MNQLLQYKLIGIGEFSHGIKESWEFRFNFIKYIIKNTNKNIYIFNEMADWQANNIMNNTIWCNNSNQFIKYDGIKVENNVDNSEDVPSLGKYWQYMNHSSESNIFLRIVRYIRKHRKRITLIGVDNEKIDRDYDMYKIIMKHYNPNNINLFFAHNAHINNQLYHDFNLDYIKNKNHKYYCGHYLKNKLKDDYCIILSQAYQGANRFNSYCEGKKCEKRIWKNKYFYKKFTYEK
jgi:erythromycin esterase-like protein